MGRVISCEIALRKGAKREGNGYPQGQLPQSQSTAAGQAAPGNTYGGSSTTAGNKPPGPTSELAAATQPAPEAEAEKVERTKKKKQNGKKSPQDATCDAISEAGNKPSAKAKGSAAVVRIEMVAAASAGSVGGVEAGGAEEGLSKKALRKAARKEMKKEIKRKAKERAKMKKEAQALEDADANKAAAGAKTAPDAAEEGEGAGGGENSRNAEESLDPRGAKMQRDSGTVLIFGVADDLTAKQLQKRVKKVGLLGVAGNVAILISAVAC